MVQLYSASENTRINSQNPALNKIGETPDMQWSKDQKEILQDCFEEKIASEKYNPSSEKQHGKLCNCVKCN